MTTYTDDTLRFCLSDGAPLAALAGAAEAETVISYNPAKPVVIDIPRENTAFAPGHNYPAPSAPAVKRGVSPLLVAAIVGLLVLVIAALGAFIFYGMYLDRKNPEIANANTATPSPTKTPAPDKSPVNVNHWTNTNKPINALPAATPDRPPDEGTPVTVHSPGDGFLSVRSQPTSKSTEITRIPHGTRIYLSKCNDASTTPAGNFGRWCTTSYNGYSGWVFDGFVRY